MGTPSKPVAQSTSKTPSQPSTSTPTSTPVTVVAPAPKVEVPKSVIIRKAAAPAGYTPMKTSTGGGYSPVVSPVLAPAAAPDAAPDAVPDAVPDAANSSVA